MIGQPPVQAGALRRESNVAGRLAHGLSHILLAILVIGFGLAFAVPVVRLVAISFGISAQGVNLTADNWLLFLWDPFNRSSLILTFQIGALTAIVSLIVGFPLALHLNASPPGRRGIYLLLLLSPLLVSVVLRTYGWIVILGSQGLVNWVIHGLGLVDEPRTLMYNKTAVIVALTQVFLPQMVLPIFVALQQQDPKLVAAASTMGASPFRAFRDVTLPLALPGVLAGAATVFALSAGSFVTVALIGGPGVFTLPVTVADNAMGLMDWQRAAGAGGLLLLINLATVMIVTSYVKRRQKGVFGR